MKVSFIWFGLGGFLVFGLGYLNLE